MRCQKCGKENPGGGEYCAYCGAGLKISAAQHGEQSARAVGHEDRRTGTSRRKALLFIGGTIVACSILFSVVWLQRLRQAYDYLQDARRLKSAGRYDEAITRCKQALRLRSADEAREVLSELYEVKADQTRLRPPREGVAGWQQRVQEIYAAAHTQQKLVSTRRRDSQRTPRLLLLEAKSLRAKGRFQEALGVLAKISDIEGHGSAFLSLQGECLLATGETAGGLDCLDKALDGGGLTLGQVLQEARVLHAESRYPESLVYLDYAISRLRGKPFEARTVWILEDKVPSLQTGFGGVPWLERSRVPIAYCTKWYYPRLNRERLQSLENATYDLTMAIAADPAYMALENNTMIGKYYAEVGRFRNALSFFRKATEIAPSQGMWWACRAMMEAALGEAAQAGKSISRALTLSPKEDVVREAQRYVSDLGRLDKH